MTYVVAMANEKGGVAKTTTALSLGGALAEKQSKVLLVDLDPQANLTLALGLRESDSFRTVTDMLMVNQPFLTVRQNTNVDNLDLVPANHDLIMAQRFLSVREHYEFILRDALEEATHYDMIILDCPPTLGPLTHSALVAAQLLIIPTQCEFFSAHALRDMLSLIQSVRQHSNPQLRYRILLTMMDQRNRLHRDLSEYIRKAFGKAVFNAIIPMDAKLRESPIFSQPITMYASDSRAAGQYRLLAQELRTYIHETNGSNS